MRVKIWKSDFRDFPGLEQRLYEEKQWTISWHGKNFIQLDIPDIHPGGVRAELFVRYLYFGW